MEWQAWRESEVERLRGYANSADGVADDLRTQLSEAQQKVRETERRLSIVAGHYQDEQDRLREAYHLLAQEWNVDVDSVAFDEAYDSARDRWLRSENDE